MTLLTAKKESRPVRSGSQSTRGYWAYLIPGAIGLTAVVFIPFGMNVYLSLTRYRGVGSAQFTGVENYTRLFADPTFWASFVNSLVFIVAMAIIPTALG